MPIHKFQGLDLFYNTFGDKDVALLFIHGLGGDGRTWRYQIDYFKSRYQVVTVDLFGHGQSSREVEPKFAPLKDAEAIISLMKEAVRKPYVAIGHSFASQILPEIIKMGDPNLKGAVFVDCTYQGFPEVIETRMGFARQMLSLSDEALKHETEKWYRGMMTDIKNSEDQNLVFRSLPNCDYRWLFQSVGGCGEFNEAHPPQETPDNIPIFVMEAGNGIGSAIEKSWVNHFKNAHYFLFDDAYHFFIVSQFQKFNELLNNFIIGCL